MKEPSWQFLVGDAERLPLADQSVDMVFVSPPYTEARLYLEGGRDLGIARCAEAWAAWMVRVVRECRRVCKGLVAFVVNSQTKDYRWDAAPALLLADLHRAGFNLRKPAVYERDGVPGSGGPDWLKDRWEWVVCVTPPGKLPWSDNTALGAAPKYGPGGKMTNRMRNGKRCHERNWKDLGKGGHLRQHYTIPDLANPGNVVDCGSAGGGRIGSELCHEGEAPFPEKLAEWFVRPFCPPGGVVLDPFSGTGTTVAVAVRHGRSGVGVDVRPSQCAIGEARLRGLSREEYRREKEGGKVVTLF